MEDIATIDLQQYIKEKLFNPETERQKIWLHNLPEENKKLFNIIELLRKEYNNETFVITQNINIRNEKINKEINFSNCIFENKISFENYIFNNNVCFTNSTFKNDVCFKKCTFIDNPFFNYSCENVIFEGENIDFSNSDFYNANFSNTIFGKNKKTLISFEGAKLSNTFFKKAKFKGKILFNKSEIENGRITEIQNTKFNEVIFFDQANFQEVIFLGSISFEKTQFKGDTFFNKTSFYNDNQNLEKEAIQVNFKHALFSKKVFFRDSKFGVDFYKAIFYCPIYFSNAKFCLKEKIYSKYAINFEKAQFKKKVNFHYSEFYNTVRFENTKFENLVDFYSAHFYNAQQFHFTDFLDRAIFSNTEFDEEVQFLHCTVDSNSYIRFESVTFKKSLDISRSNFNDKANFWNIEIEEGGILTSSKYQDDFEVHKNEINSKKTVPSIYKQLRETYRIIKSNFYSQNNKIEGLKFYKREMSVYEREKRHSPSDTILLFANKFSTNFGTNWFRGVVFTMLIGSIFSFLLLLTNYNLWHIDIYDINAWIQSIGFLIRIINVVDMKPFEENGNSLVKLVDNNDTNNIILFIGRIFIAYGIYQTVQAFRKFGKS